MLADRLFTGGPQWKQAVESRADSAVACKLTMKFACIQRLEDGSTSATSIPTATTAAASRRSDATDAGAGC